MAADREGRQRQRRLSVLKWIVDQGCRTMGKVIGLFTSSAPGERMRAHLSVRALAGYGLEGDRYARGQGSYSRLEPPVARHVSLIRSEDIEVANKELMRRGLVPFSADETRRNIVVEGASMSMRCSDKNFASVTCACVAPIRPDHAASRPRSQAKLNSGRHITVAGEYVPKYSRMVSSQSAMSSPPPPGSVRLAANSQRKLPRDSFRSA